MSASTSSIRNQVPNSNTIDQHNLLTSKMEEAQKLQNDDLSRIAAVDTGMRETVALIMDVAERQLNILNQLLKQPAQSRDFAAASADFKTDLQKVWQDNFEDYGSLLSARKHYMENGQEILLTKEKREQLKREFATTLDETFSKLEIEYQISPQADLEKLKKETEEKIKIHNAISDRMLDNKTMLTQRVYRNIENVRNLAQLRQKLHSPEVTDVWTACRAGAIDYLGSQIKKLWFWEVKEFINKQNSEGNTLLHEASQHGHFEIVQLLLNKRANPDIRNNDGYLPIHLAAKYGAAHIINAFLHCKPPVDVNVRGAYGRTPLHMASFNSCYETAELLIKRGADVNAQTDREDHFKTALHDAAIHLDELMVSTLLKSPRLNVNIHDVQHHSPLYHAILDGCYNIVVLIMGHVSWKSPQDSKDPNHIDRLLQLIPKYNAEKIQKFIRDSTGRSLPAESSSSSGNPSSSNSNGGISSAHALQQQQPEVKRGKEEDLSSNSNP